MYLLISNTALLLAVCIIALIGGLKMVAFQMPKGCADFPNWVMVLPNLMGLLLTIISAGVMIYAVVVLLKLKK